MMGAAAAAAAAANVPGRQGLGPAQQAPVGARVGTFARRQPPCEVVRWKV